MISDGTGKRQLGWEVRGEPNGTNYRRGERDPGAADKGRVSRLNRAHIRVCPPAKRKSLGIIAAPGFAFRLAPGAMAAQTQRFALTPEDNGLPLPPLDP